MENINKINKLNLGCGNDIREGYLNIDFERFKGIDKIIDLDKIPYPFKNDQFQEIVINNVLEHLENPYAVLKEIHRISRSRAVIKIMVPHFSSSNSWGDIQHKRGFNLETFTNKNVTSMFKVIKNEVTFSKFRLIAKALYKLNHSFYEKHLAYIFPANDLYVELKVLK